MSDQSHEDGFISGIPTASDRALPEQNGPEPAPEEPPAPAPPSDMEQRWAHFEALAVDVASVINHLANVLPSASPLGRIADNIKARLAQFKELIAEQQK